MKDALKTYADSDSVMDRAMDAPKAYADALTALVAEGWADRLPYGVKGKPTAQVAAAKREVTEAFQAVGVTGAPALRARVLRATYAIHVLAANPRRDGESDEAYVTRCATIRKIANNGDVTQVEKALKGEKATAKRKARNMGGTGGKGKASKGDASKGDQTPETPETPEPVTVDPAKALVLAHNALMAAIDTYAQALTEFRATGGKPTAASLKAAKTKATELLAAIA